MRRAQRSLAAAAKAALWSSPTDLRTFKGPVGRAVRMPTVAELYQGSISANTVVNDDPTPKPEKSWTGKLTAKRDFGNRRLRATLFHERTTDALYWQTHVTNIQNVNAVRTTGLELAAQADGAGLTGWNRAGA